MPRVRVALSVIMPVFNEEKTVAQVLKKLVKIRAVREVLVVDDGSRDATKKQIQKVKHPKIKYFYKKNEGKGSAVRLGLKKAQHEYILIQDADLEYDPEDIPALIEPIARGRVQVVYGSRFLGPHLNLLFWHYVGNNFLNLTINLLYNTTLSDMETCYKVMPTRVLRKLDIRSKNFDIEPEITCKLLRRGVKIFEVPISYMGRDYAEGKKIKWTDGITALQMILKLRLQD